MKVDIKRLREHLACGKRIEIYGEGTLAASEVLRAAPALLDEIERLRAANKEIAEHCCKQYKKWHDVRNDPNSDSLKQDKATSSMLAYLDIGRKLD